MELKGFILTEPWGKRGRASGAAAMFWGTEKRNKALEDVPYSRFVVDPSPGAHCIIVENGQIFGKFLSRYPELLGQTQFGELPFKVSVYSVGSIRPLMINPNKAEAEMLNEKSRSICSDRNHKPMMIISIDEFELLCGLKPLEEIKKILYDVPELSFIIPAQTIDDFAFTHLGRGSLRSILTAWLSANQHQMKFSIDTLFERLEYESVEVQDNYNFGLMKRLHEKFPYDPGVYAPFFLNHILLPPKEAVFIDCGTPYLFLGGDCVLVSTRSDNKIQLALAEEGKRFLKDGIPCIKIGRHSAEMFHVKPNFEDEFTFSLTTPIPEFAVDKIEAEPGGLCSLRGHKSCSILLVVQGQADGFIRPSLNGQRSLKKGRVVFLLPHQIITFAVLEKIVIYVVYVNTELSIS